MAVAGHRTTATVILRAGLLVSIAGFAVAIQGNAAMAVTGIIVAGLGVGAMYPALMSLTSQRVTPEAMASVVGYQVAAATAGAAAGVGLPAVVFQELGVVRYPATMLALAIAATILIGPLTRQAGSRS
jgi:MFS family permease